MSDKSKYPTRGIPVRVRRYDNPSEPLRHHRYDASLEDRVREIYTAVAGTIVYIRAGGPTGRTCLVGGALYAIIGADDEERNDFLVSYAAHGDPAEGCACLLEIGD